jgi:hypothetical protein
MKTTVHTILTRLFGAEQPTEQVHFHNRGTAPEACHDAGCRLPRLDA